MHQKGTINLGIGFATGRKSFQQVLRTYIYSWKESGLIDNQHVRLNLFIAYDVKYSKTKPSDYTNISRELLGLVDGVVFIGQDTIEGEIKALAAQNIVSLEEGGQFFRGGYSGMRNAVLYFAIKHDMDYLLFLDDDEYPLAVTKTRETSIWSGQHVLLSHLHHIRNADITHGHHCGYISPIPSIPFDGRMEEGTFRTFIEALSNDIVKWETVKATMQSGGVTYADKEVLMRQDAQEVEEVNRAKFISGSNLCLNLTRPERVNAFYNPPGARGEDTFLSTTLTERTVLKVPCYTFHDGFSTHRHLLDGVLPIRLPSVTADTVHIVTRFYRACVGWVRYKPLLTYITRRDEYEERIADMRRRLMQTIPAVGAYFGHDEFSTILDELKRYHNDVRAHYREFMQTQVTWAHLRAYAKDVPADTDNAAV